ncbi:hypothetical protein [Teredinibacter turnerae]|nr:hypothetical protein [Teredinibacter turnerae]
MLRLLRFTAACFGGQRIFQFGNALLLLLAVFSKLLQDGGHHGYGSFVP